MYSCVFWCEFIDLVDFLALLNPVTPFIRRSNLFIKMKSLRSVNTKYRYNPLFFIKLEKGDLPSLIYLIREYYKNINNLFVFHSILLCSYM